MTTAVPVLVPLSCLYLFISIMFLYTKKIMFQLMWTRHSPLILCAAARTHQHTSSHISEYVSYQLWNTATVGINSKTGESINKAFACWDNKRLLQAHTYKQFMWKPVPQPAQGYCSKARTITTYNCISASTHKDGMKNHIHCVEIDMQIIQCGV